MRCEGCGREVDPRAVRFCPDCGQRVGLGSVSEDATVVAGPGAPASGAASSSMAGPSSAAWLGSDSSVSGTFTPGTILLERYRIIGLLGKGGMGEVYRADDLVLQQAVALKFLPEDLARDPDRLERFRNEVRIARQVSHPNVCRVYDIGHYGGRPFLTMEYIDGEDLAGLLRRIGRLPKDKAVDIGRQVCAGLAAAHAAGVLHRDLKPGNVMLDSQGRVHLTDFGLAVLQEHSDGDKARVGTPAYMAPEQLAGGEATVRSDIYALGLVLYEMLTGRRPFQARSLDELSQMQSSGVVDSPSTLVGEVDPAMERAVLRCLESEPDQRPPSVVSVAASLPGGDPLAAALEAGEVPSPEVVAAAATQGQLRPAVAWALLLVALGSLVSLLLLADQYYLVRHTTWSKPPAVLEDRARELAAQFGAPEHPKDAATGLVTNRTYLRWVAQHDSSASRWERLRTQRPSGLLFWYRQSPTNLVPRNSFGNWGVSYWDPPHTVPGMTSILLDPQGHLLRYEFVPSDVDSGLQPETPDAGALLAAGGFDPARLEETTPVWVPPHYVDERRAWIGTWNEGAGDTVRVEAGFHAGRLTYYDVHGAWSTPSNPGSSSETLFEKVGATIAALMFLLLLLFATLLARNHLRQGKGDRAGASRLAFFIFGITFSVWLLAANHLPSANGEIGLLMPALALIVFLSAMFWVVYIALEPFMRRLWPDRIVTWTRLLRGRWRDPQVARDFLVGAAFAGVVMHLELFQHLIPAWLHKPPPQPEITVHATLLGFRGALVALLSSVVNTMFSPLALLFGLLGFRQLFRRQSLAVVAMLVLLTILPSSNDPTPANLVLNFLTAAVFLFVALRFGLLAFMVTFVIGNMLQRFPASWDFTPYFAWHAMLGVFVAVAVALYSFRYAVARGRRPS